MHGGRIWAESEGGHGSRFFMLLPNLGGEWAFHKTTDPLTGVHSRSGFLALAEQQFKLLQRKKRSFVLLFVELEMRRHPREQDLQEKAQATMADLAIVLKKILRASDIVGRVSEDQFAGMMIEMDTENIATLTRRLNENLKLLQEEAQNRQIPLLINFYPISSKEGSAESFFDFFQKASHLILILSKNRRARKG